jgi:hypothetical protein
MLEDDDMTDAHENGIPGYASRVEAPLWVRIGLCGIPSRRWAWVCFWFSIALSVGMVAYGLGESAVQGTPLPSSRPFILWSGTLMPLATLWYYLCIRWKDRHQDW